VTRLPARPETGFILHRETRLDAWGVDPYFPRLIRVLRLVSTPLDRALRLNEPRFGATMPCFPTPLGSSGRLGRGVARLSTLNVARLTL
jgi:hypothetical protein